MAVRAVQEDNGSTALGTSLYGHKDVHIHGADRNGLLLTVIDVYFRKVLIHMLKFNIRKGDIIAML